MKTSLFIYAFLFCFGTSPIYSQDVALNVNQRDFLLKMLPEIQKVNQEVWQMRTEIVRIKTVWEKTGNIPDSSMVFLSKISKKYNINSFVLDDQKDHAAFEKELEDLLLHVDIIPVKLVMAQAIIESGWGKSSFAKEGNNYFGIHCYTQGCGMIPKGSAKAGFEVKRFPTIESAIEDYIHILNTCYAYNHLRTLRAELRQSGAQPDAIKLAVGLSRYSQKGSSYISLVQQIITRYLPENIEGFLKKWRPKA